LHEIELIRNVDHDYTIHPSNVFSFRHRRIFAL